MEQINTLYLDETQNSEFDQEYHSAPELRHKTDLISSFFPQGPKRILDVGGGNGDFIDRLLNAFPNAEGINLDVSKLLLDRNRPHARKRLLCASVSEVRGLLGDQCFDVITLNWLLHHLVGPDYRTCRANCTATLRLCSDLLTPDGIIIVAENLFDGFFRSNVPSRVIYELTRIRQPNFTRLARKFFNTAGVGVCFRSEASWRRLFRDTGFSISNFYHGDIWPYGLANRLMRAALFLSSQRHGHFFLRPAGLNPLHSGAAMSARI